MCLSISHSHNLLFVLAACSVSFSSSFSECHICFAHNRSFVWGICCISTRNFCSSMWKLEGQKSFDFGFFWSRNTPLSDIEKQNVSLGDCLSVYVPTFPSATFVWRAEMEKDCAMKFSSCSFAPSHFVVFSCLPAPSLPWQAFQLCISDENSAVQTTEFSMRQFSDWVT